MVRDRVSRVIGNRTAASRHIHPLQHDITRQPHRVVQHWRDPSQGQPGVTINLPPVVAPVDDGQRYYYVQVNLALELDRSGTAGLIQARHDAIDRQMMEILHTYAVSDLRATGQLPALRADIRRAINKLLPKGQVQNVYITNWLMTPVGY